MAKVKDDFSLFNKLTSLYIGVLLSVFLLYPGMNGYQGIASAKYHAFLIVCGGYAALTLLLLIENLLVGQVKFSALKDIVKRSSWPQKLIVLFLIISWISAIVSPYFPETVIGVSRNEGVLTITIYCLCFLFVSVFGKAKRWMLIELAAVTFLFSILCIIQLFGGNPFTLYPEGYDYFGAYKDYSGAYLGTIGNVDLVAGFLCIVIPIFTVSLIRLREKWRWLLIIPLAASVFVLVKMWVLAGIVGIVVGLVVSVIVVIQVPGKTKKHIAFGLIVCAAAMICVLFFGNFKSGMLFEIHEILHGRVSETFGTGRIHIWTEVLARVPDRLILGHGPDTMLYAELPAFTRFDETYNVMIRSAIDVAHNDYLNILYHQGFLGLITYLGALVFLAVKWIKSSKTSNLCAICGSAALCYCIQAFFSFNMFITAPFFWLILALLDGFDIV